MTSAHSARESQLRGSLPPGFTGVIVQLDPTRLHLHAAYRLPPDHQLDFPGGALRSVVLVVQRDLQPSTLVPFGSSVLFEDDQVVSAAGVDGAFTVDLVASLAVEPRRREGRYHVFVTMGPFASNVVEADVSDET